MTDHSVGALPPLGVGAIVGESFSLFFGRFVTFFLLAFVPSLISIGLSVAFNGAAALGGGSDADALAMITSPVGLITTFLIPMVIYGITTALMVCAAYDAKLGRPARMGQYISIGLARAVPVIIVSVIVGIIVTIGSMLLLVPGLYALALFSTATTVVVLESMGVGALSRSIQLTKEYRWPILGAIILLYIVILVLNMIVGFAILPIILGLGGAGLIIGIIVQGAIGAIGTAIISIGFVLIYARLREIKEGVSVDSLVEVFS